MGMRAVEIGITGELVRRRIAELRGVRGLTLAKLSARLGEMGYPLLPSGLSKIEHGERRIDVDDLVALAAALDISAASLIDPAPITVVVA